MSSLRVGMGGSYTDQSVSSIRPAPAASVAAVVLERDAEADAVLLDRPVLDRHVLADDLGDPQVADRLRGRLDGVLRRIRPRVGARPDHLGDAVHVSGHAAPFVRGCADRTLSPPRPAYLRALGRGEPGGAAG